MNIKAVALDLDGTFLDSNNKPNNETIDLIGKLRNRGIKIFFASGRTKLEIEEVLPAGTEIDGMVTANGMGCYIKDRKILQHSLPSQLVREVVDLARNSNVYYEVHPLDGRRFALEADRNYMFDEVMREKAETVHDNEYNARQNAIEQQIYWAKEICAEDVVKVYFFSMSLDKIQEWDKKLQELQKKHSFTISSSSAHSNEISVSNVSKATGIELLLKEYNISTKNLLAVGDADNDIPMFILAGHAVAMKNANEHVKQFADDVTEFSYDECGLYHYLKEKFAEILCSANKS